MATAVRLFRALAQRPTYITAATATTSLVRSRTIATESSSEAWPHHKRRKFVPTTDERVKQKWENRKDSELERASRLGTLNVPTPDIMAMTDEEWIAHRFPNRIRSAGLHYDIFASCFRKAFVPSAKLIVDYENNAVHRGNILDPSEVKEFPEISFTATGDKHAVALLGLDSRLDGQSGHLLHYLKLNVEEASELSATDAHMPYLPVIPAKGSGYHRFAWVLYTQPKEIAFEIDDSLIGRHIDAKELQTEHGLRAIGLAFFQAEWDPSVSEVWTSRLERDEPKFTQN